jgi:diacylglycerol kinase (CTP)
MRNGGRDVTWSWNGGVMGYSELKNGSEIATDGGGPLGLLVIALVAGVVSGVAEALGAWFNAAFGFLETEYGFFLDLGSIDDNLSLPIISGCCILGFIKVLGLAAPAFSPSSWFS